MNRRVVVTGIGAVTPVGNSAQETWEALKAGRAETDAAIEACAARLEPAWLAGRLSWFSAATGREMTRPTWMLVTHLFNHQTHHRGQAHDMITQAGVRPAATDLPWIVDRRALGIA